MKRTTNRPLIYISIILAVGVLLALFAIPYFATRPLSRDKLMHTTPQP